MKMVAVLKCILLVALLGACLSSPISSSDDLDMQGMDLQQYLMDNKEYFNNEFPEMYTDTPGICRLYNYESESHDVMTKDGFILTMHRIPPKSGVSSKGAVLLGHGLMAASSCWVLNDKSRSLAFVLADAGYDVWMTNNRGTTYSREHKTLKPSDSDFWDWSFEEMARYDLPANVDHVLKSTNSSKIIYIGHSQGTTQAFIELGRNPSLNKKLSKFIALAPVAQVKNAAGTIKMMKYIISALKGMYALVGDRELLSHSWIMKFTAKYMCALSWTGPLCANMMFMINGFDQKNFNQTRMPVYLAHMPAGSSLKDIMHWSQFLETGEFKYYDYGWKNYVRYGQAHAPHYTPEQITVPVAIFGGQKDWIATPADVSVLHKKLHNVFHDEIIPEYNHLDFVWAKNADTAFFPKLLEVLAKDV